MARKKSDDIRYIKVPSGDFEPVKVMFPVPGVPGETVVYRAKHGFREIRDGMLMTAEDVGRVIKNGR